MRGPWEVALVLAVAAAGCQLPPTPGPPALRLALPAVNGVEASPLDAAISPDERQIVFAGVSDGVARLWLRPLDADRAEPIPGTEGAQMPAWKRTGNVVAFFADGRLKQVSIPSNVVADLAAAPSPGGATWLADGSLLFVPDRSGPIRRLLNGESDGVTTLAEGDRGHVFPQARGHSNDFVYVALRADDRRIVRLVSGGAGHDLTSTSGHATLVDDVLLHVDDGVLLAYRFDPGASRLQGRGIPVVLESGVSDAGAGLFAASAGLLIHSRPIARAREVVWLDRAGAHRSMIGDAGEHWQVRLSPDDRDVAVTTRDPLLGTLDVFVTPAAGGYTERLTLSLSADSAPVWSPRGDRVLFRSLHEGVPGLFARRAHLKGAEDDVILESPLDETATEWLPDGSILFHARTATGFDIFRFVPGGRTPEPIIGMAFNETDARSKDGRLIAYVSDESGQPDVYVRHPDRSRQRISFGGGTRPRWGRDGRTLFFLRGSQLMRATVERGSLGFANAQPLFDIPGVVDFDVAHRSDRFLVIRALETAAPAAPGAIVNWQSLLRQGLQER